MFSARLERLVNTTLQMLDSDPDPGPIDQAKTFEDLAVRIHWNLRQDRPKYGGLADFESEAVMAWKTARQIVLEYKPVRLHEDFKRVPSWPEGTPFRKWAYAHMQEIQIWAYQMSAVHDICLETEASARAAEVTRWHDVKDRLEALCDRDEISYTSLSRLGKRMHCSGSTITKAINASEKLQIWKDKTSDLNRAR